MPNFKDLKSLFSYINKNLKFSLQEVGQQVEQIIKDYIMEHLYNAYTPSDYSRTYDFINSLSVKKVQQSNNGYIVELFFDTNRIISYEVEDRYWNQHMNIDGSDTWNGEKINEWIPIWLEKGVSGSLWDRDGIDSMKNVKNELEATGKHIKMIVDILKKKGFKVEWKN